MCSEIYTNVKAKLLNTTVCPWLKVKRSTVTVNYYRLQVYYKILNQEKDVCNREAVLFLRGATLKLRTPEEAMRGREGGTKQDTLAASSKLIANTIDNQQIKGGSA